MSGRHVQSAGGGRARVWLAGLGVALAAVLVALFASPATAASQTVNSQLSLSGLASADNPLGGSQIGLHPGDKATFSAAGVPTAGLDKLGLGDLVGGLLNGITKFQVTADFSALPGGKKNTVLSGATKAAFSFPKVGTYKFTWTAQKVIVGLLGTQILQVDLDGNQLAKAGVKLNASNAYVGQVVVAKNPPAGGLSVQLPSVKVAPSLPVVGQLPTISIPGATLPTVHVSVPNLNPGGGKSAGASTTAKAPTAPSYTYKPPALSVPQQVVPQGDSGPVYGGSGGFQLGTTSGGQGAGKLTAVSPNVSPDKVSAGGSTTSALPEQDSSGKDKTVNLASSANSPSGQLPVLLAILAVIALAVVAGTYARLYLLGRKSQG